MTQEPCSTTRTTLRLGGRWVWTGYEGALTDDTDRARFDQAWLAPITKALTDQAPSASYEQGTSEITVCIEHAGDIDTDAAMATAEETSRDLAEGAEVTARDLEETAGELEL